MQRQVWLGVILGTASLLVVPYGPGAILEAQTSPALPLPQVKARVEVVQVDVSVVDAAGHPVPDLVAEDFSLEEDGVAQTIEAFKSVTPAEPAPAEPWTRDRVSTNTSPAASSGRTFMLVFDDLQLSPRGAERARAAATEFIKGLGRGDRVGATSTSGRVWSSGALPRDREAVLSAVKRVEGMRPPESQDADQMSDYEAMRIAEYNDSVVLRSVENRLGRDQKATIQSWAVDPTGGPAEVAPGPFSSGMGAALGPGAGSGDRNPRRSMGSVSSERMLAQTLATQLYERVKQRRGQVLQSIIRVLGSLGQIEGRKAVILLSEGFLHDPDDRRFAALSNACRRASATIYAFDIGGLLGSGGEAGQQRSGGGRPLDERAVLRAGLESVASDSGGFAVTNTNDPAGGLGRVVEESSHYYLLGYRSTKGPPDGKYRRIRVSVRRPGVEVRARPGYFALAEAASAGAGGGAAEASLRLREARDAPAPLSGLPLRMSSYSFDRTREGTTRTLLVSEVRLEDVIFEEKEKRLTAELDVLLTVTDTAPGMRGATVTNSLKPATTETGLVVPVPSFIDVGDVIRVDTESGEYLSRAK